MGRWRPMIKQVIPPTAPRPPDPVDRWRRSWLALLALTAVVATGLLARHTLRSEAAQVPVVSPPATASAYPSAPVLETTTLPSPSATPSKTPAPASHLLRLPG